MELVPHIDAADDLQLHGHTSGGRVCLRTARRCAQQFACSEGGQQGRLAQELTIALPPSFQLPMRLNASWSTMMPERLRMAVPATTARMVCVMSNAPRVPTTRNITRIPVAQCTTAGGWLASWAQCDPACAPASLHATIDLAPRRALDRECTTQKHSHITGARGVVG